MRTALILIIALILVAAGLLWVNRPVTVAVAGRVPRDFPENGFSHQVFEALLERFVDASGSVDYDAWQASADAMNALETYLAAVAAYSPESAPHRFASSSDELAYWIYGYNAYVIRSILHNWPLESVTDVKAPLEAVKGLGFFYRNRYLFGGRAYSLLAVENENIRKRYRDPRIHFVLNCGSESCPVLRPELPTGDELEVLLAKAAREFVADPRNLFVDHADKVIYLSAIFKMYRDDFVNHARAGGRPVGNGILAYISSVAPKELQAEIARAQDYAIEFRDFDWSLNVSAEASPD